MERATNLECADCGGALDFLDFSQPRNPERCRAIVDIANKALSPAVNDPTTAVLAIDHIHHLLRDIGKRSLGEGRETDRKGQLRLMYRTPNWEDFVLLGTTEIRQYGRDSIQVQRRLRAMLKDLIESLPARRSPVLQKELALLANLSKRAFPDLADQTLAESGDLQASAVVMMKCPRRTSSQVLRREDRER